MSYCAVKWCGKSSKTSSNAKDGITFHRFPKSPERKKKWMDLSSDPPLENTPSTPTSSTRNRRDLHSVSFTPSAYDSPVKKRLCRKILELNNKIKVKNVQLKKIRASNRKLKRQIVSLQSLLAELEKNMLTTENNEILTSLGVKCSEIIRRQMLKPKSGAIVRKKYSPELRAFALTLNFYSTKAYNYVRKTFNTRLPSVKTLGKWYRSVDGRPGFTKEALAALKIKSKESENPIYCCIIFDEMKIETKIEKSYGYIDFGGCIETDSREECTDALVYLVVPLHSKWKVPIGYFLINKVTADQKVFLLKQAIEFCNEANIIVKAVTFDGCPTNIAMAKKLGCDFNLKTLKTTFKIQSNEIAVFLDPAHMIKLVRNTFDFDKEFKNADCKSIKWNHIELLHQLQENEKFHAANKLRAEHLYFKKNIMKVKLATQLFSRSVALALRFCKNTLQLEQFNDIEETATMLMNLNDLFDILDSKVYGYGFKKALNSENAEIVLPKLEECKNMLMNLSTNLKNKQTKLIESPRHTGFLGLCVGIESANFLYNDLIYNKRCRYISFHRISQDHIELLFCNIRFHGGANNNPTPKQFHGIYKKILVHIELQETNTGNCIALENIAILNCSSAIKRINITTKKGDIWESEKFVDGFIEALQQISLSQFSESIVEYIAGAVVHYLIKHIICNTCVRSLVSLGEKKTSLIYIRDVGGLLYPSSQVVKMCRRCEQVIRNSLNSNNSKMCYNDKYRFVTITLKTFINEDLFPELKSHQFDHESCNHIIDLAKSVMEKYIDISLLYLSRKTNPKEAIRRVYTKLIHFKNQ